MPPYLSLVLPAHNDADIRQTVSEMGHRARRTAGEGPGYARGDGAASGEIVGYADADNKVPIAEFARLEPWFGEFPIVTGWRASDRSLVEKEQPLYRRIGSVGFHWFMHAATGLWHITDSQCGFKFFRRDAPRDLFARQQIDGYMFGVETLALAQALGYAVKEVPIRWRDDGDSRLELVPGNLRNVRGVMRIRGPTAAARAAASNTTERPPAVRHKPRSRF